jgi:PAS domain S-box-containing protein
MQIFYSIDLSSRIALLMTQMMERTKNMQDEFRLSCGLAQRVSRALRVSAVVLMLAGVSRAAEPLEIRAGSELDFRPYAFTDKEGQPIGFGVELLQAVAEKMGLHLRITPGQWDKVWNELVAGKLDVLPVVARTAGRESLVDFSSPHTQTFDAFFVREGRTPIKDLAAAAGKEIVVLRSDAAHHQLIERNFPGKVIPVESIPEGLRLIAAGKHDAFLCSKLIGMLECEQAGIPGVQGGPLIPDYNREFSFAVPKGRTELLEQLNQGLRIVKSDGTYNRLYLKWLDTEEAPLPQWHDYFFSGLAVIAVCALIVIAWRISREAAKWDDRLLRVLAPKRLAALPEIWRYALVVAGVAAGTALRAAMIPWLGTVAPYELAIIMTVAATILLGTGPGLLTILLGYIAVEVFVVGSWPVIFEEVTLVRLGVAMAIGVLIVFSLHAARVATVKARGVADALQASEEQYRLLFEAANDGVVLHPLSTDRESCRFTRFNSVASRMLGYSEAEMAQLSPLDIQDTADIADLQAEAEQMNRDRQRRVERILITRDGRHLPAEIHSTIFDLHGQTMVLSIIRDITERKKAEAEQRRAKEELELRVLERTRELASRADQLRALAGELTLAEQRERSRLAKVLHDHLQQLLVAAKFRVAILGRGGDELLKQGTKEVEDLLDESIAASRSLTAELSPPILHEVGLSAGLQWLARRMAETHGLFVDLELEESGPLPESAKILLFESVRELLFNVVKHANVRSAIVSMKRSDDSLVVIVSDHGKGFDPASLYAAGEAGKPFGLLVIRERLELMGGKFKIESIPGEGSQFVLSLPVAPLEGIKPQPQQANASVEAQLISQVHPEKRQKIRVLLVDDHAMVRQGIANLLGSEPDIEIVGQAANGPEAVDLASRLLPQVVLMDMSMAKLTGVEATREICNGWPEIRVIGLSMFEEGVRKQEMLDAGAVDYISKSGPADDLIGSIRKSIQSPLKAQVPQKV